VSRVAAAVLALLAASVLGLAPVGAGEAPAAPGEWRSFEGSWSAVGTRQIVPTEGDRPAAIARVTGAVVITSGEGLSRGFQGEAIYFDDGRGVGVGRCVWTDDRGDRIYSELKGEQSETGRRVAGTITGGTGRYAGLTGEYSLSWQYVVHSEDGVMQSRTADLKGRVRRGEASR
jgi:hypothetical protein